MIARHSVAAGATFCYVPRSLPMFLIVPAVLRRSTRTRAIVAGCGVTILLYLALIPVAARFCVTL
ncbi:MULTISPECIES: hypothetical protein [unclassified Sphingomonas]|uniref:hypothetical protein n=1 Tax=unclassified Sphingomonas TaxID=196159 RepID=UPI0006FF4240|nr:MULTISPECIES: hypothetical protein [unclassified Sphingomonas]KQM61815.1 hypothetical protein ASE65_06290 [Sphingomonas sp. Leaf16]KQN13089.1 hypothetical protein ASE81_07305 [Sphingomonas sp. Leaf29]KQN19975.1 hypothetical protein ASE83_07230 [Sphingomonas sp. Leaf32]